MESSGWLGRVSVKLGREKGVEGQWTVRELLQVIRDGESWDEENNLVEDCSSVVGDVGTTGQPVTKVCCSVVGVRGVRVEVKMPRQEVKVFSLTGVWEESFHPRRGDLVQVSLRLVSDDLEDLVGSEVVSVKPARVLSSDGCVTSWDQRKGEGLVRGDIWLQWSACPHGYRPSVGDSVSLVAVECLPSPPVWGCGWRVARAAPREGRQGGRHLGGLGGRTDQGVVVRGQGRSYSKTPSFTSLKLPEYPVPPSLCDPYITSPALLYSQLTEPLSPSNYNSKLHTLLHLESVSAQQSMSRYSMTGQALTRAGPYLSLTVSGMLEGRPRLMQGDSAILSTPGMSGGGPQYEGCIHEVRGDSLMMKFSSQFQLSYCGEMYDVSFLLSRTQVRRQHRAVEMAEGQLGYEVIFPSKVVIKDPQVVVVDPKKMIVKSPVQADRTRRQDVKGKPFRKLVRNIDSQKLQRTLDSHVRGVGGGGDCSHGVDGNSSHGIVEGDRSQGAVDRGHGGGGGESSHDVLAVLHSHVVGAGVVPKDNLSRKHHSDGEISNNSEQNEDMSNHGEVQVLGPDVKNRILAKLSSPPNNPSPHPLVKPRGRSGSGQDDLRRKVLLSSLPVTSVDISSPVWSVPCLESLTPPSPSSKLLLVLPHSFLPPPSPSPPPYYPLPPPTTPLTWLNTTLNPEQRSAVTNILSGVCRPIPYILYGPPGTGKTVTLVEAILQTFILRGDSRLLVCTPSNSSADLITSRLIASGKIVYGDLARLNAFQRNCVSVPEVIQPYCFLPEEEGGQLDSVARHRVVVTTCSTAGTLYRLGLRAGHFSHVFIDEAGHVTEPEVLIPLCLLHSSVGQLVLAGDPQQLGPTLTSNMATMYGLEQSFLERLANRPIYLRDQEKFGHHGGYDPMVLTKLVRNYRSHEDILSIPSKLFYSGELMACASPSIMNRFTGNALGTLLPAKDHPIVFQGVKGDNCQEAGCTSWYNPQEVWQVVRYVKELLVMGVLPMEIGIIAPYRAQGAKVRDMLSSLGIEWAGLKVGSVEEFQGQERAVIILTTVRSGETSGPARQGLGFLASVKRFNVALTRAQSLLVVVGDPELLSTDSTWVVFLRKVVEMGGYTGSVLPECLV